MKQLYILPFLLLIISCGTSTNIEQQIFYVKEGDSIRNVTQRLINEKIITKKKSFRILAKVTGKESKLKIGTYSINPQISYNELLTILISGKSISSSITIPEGFNVFQIAYLLEKQDIVTAQAFLTEIYQPYWLKKIGLLPNPPYEINSIKKFSDYNNTYFAVPINPPKNSLEGFLFPDTYFLEKNMTASNIVALMLDRFFEIIDSSLQQKIEDQGKTILDVINLASIIQKEASNNEEMPKVAGVYQNRLNRKMILQADPTLIYALILDGEYNGNIRTKHLRPPWVSSYNTYYVKTLPPGPISNPGIQAILATLNPIKHNYLYFVGNPEGKHTFSKTLTEHNKAVARWVQHKK